MRKIFILAKTLLKSGESFDTKGNKKRWWVPIVLGFAFLSVAFSLGTMTYGIYDGLAPFDMQQAIVPLAFGLTSVMIFFFGIFYTVSVMYHASDVSMLQAMPLRPYQILGAKFITLVVYEYIFEAFVLLPILIAYGIKAGVGAVYVVYSLVLFALLPAIALVMASVLIMLVMRFTRFGKNKQVFNFIGGIIALVLAIGFNVMIQTSVVDITPEKLVDFASKSDMFTGIFPGTGFASDALVNSASLSGLWNLLLFVLCTAVATGVFLGAGQLLYFKGLAGVTEAAARRKKLSDEQMEKVTGESSVMRSYVLKEMRLLVRSPIAFLNCVLTNFLWPAIIVVMLFAYGQSLEQVAVFVQMIEPSVIFSVLVGFATFLASSNGITSTAISREGQSLYLTKAIPIAMKKQLFAKTIPGILFSGVDVLLLCVLAMVLGVDVIMSLLALVLGLVLMTAVSFVGLLLDISNPKLTWTNEQQAIKQNMNVMLHMLVGLAMAALVILPPVLGELSLPLTVLYVAAVSVVLVVLMGNLVSKSARKIEEMDA